MPSLPHRATGNWGFDAQYPGMPPDGKEVHLMDEEEYWDPKEQMFFCLAKVGKDDVRIYSKRPMAEIDEDFGEILSRDRNRVYIGKRKYEKMDVEDPVVPTVQIDGTEEKKRLITHPYEETEPFPTNNLELNEIEQLEVDEDEHWLKNKNREGRPSKYKNTLDEFIKRQDGPPTPNETMNGFPGGGIRVSGYGADKVMQNPDTGEWHQWHNGKLNKESLEQQEQKLVETREFKAKRIKATPGQMARGVAQAARQTIAGGFAASSVATARYQACLGCEHFDRSSSRCTLCGCFMRAKVKVALATCPGFPSKWPA